MVVEIPFRLQNSRALRQNVPNRVLSRGFPSRPRDSNQRFSPQTPDSSSQRLQCSKGVVHSQQVGDGPIAGKVVFAHHRSYRALAQRLSRKVVAIQALTFDREEQFSSPNGARVDRISLRYRFVIKFTARGQELPDSRKWQLHAFFPASAASQLWPAACKA